MWGGNTYWLVVKNAPMVLNTRKYFNPLHLLQFTCNLYVYKVFYFYVMIYIEVKFTCSISHSSSRYCMRVKLEEVPIYWTCEECTPRDVRRRKGRLSKTPLNLDGEYGSIFSILFFNGDDYVKYLNISVLFVQTLC